MILCCGEALIDMLPRTLASGEEAWLPVAGGAIFNTAITIGRLGGQAGFFSALSSDMMGDVLRKSLAQSGVDAHYCHLSARPTTLAFVKLTNGNAKYQFYDEGSAGRMLSSDDLPELEPAVRALHFGAISLIPEPCGSAYEKLMMREANNRVISFDPNIRPGFITDESAHRQRMFRMLDKADIVKLSDEDFNWLVTQAEQPKAIARWLQQGRSIIIITRGAEGAEFHTSNGVLQLAAPQTKVVDTVGAGDSFNGGFLHALNQGGLLTRQQLKAITPGELEAAADLAMRVAAITVSRAGANPPWAHELL